MRLSESVEIKNAWEIVVKQHLAGWSSRSADAVRIVQCRHQYGNLVVLDDINLDIEAGELVTLLGQSGSGKTTLLRILAGLIIPMGGDILLAGSSIVRQPAEKRHFGMVFQNYALFPHLTVAENVSFPLKVRRRPKSEIQNRVEEVLQLVNMTSFAERYPAQLSGGQQQRVAIARAIAFYPRLLLMDEPLGALDRRLRQELQHELRDLQKRLGITTVYVTHDQEEAFAISDRIAVMNAGKIVQYSRPIELYREPNSPFVADFVGELNSYEGTIEHSGDNATVRIADDVVFHIGRTDLARGTKVLIGIRPEDVELLSSENVSSGSDIAATVKNIGFSGSFFLVEAELRNSKNIIFRLKEIGSLAIGSKVDITVLADKIRVFER